MNITYLFGAGASCNCLPTYKDFSDRFAEFSSFLQRHKVQVGAEDQSILNEILLLLSNIQSEFNFHNTPDTIAKKYFHLNNGTELVNLKNSLILFFLHEQIRMDQRYEDYKLVKEIVDKRYDSYIASILKPIPKKLELINNLSILTWNYDLQFEIAFSKYLNSDIGTVQDYIQSFPKIRGSKKKFDNDKFSLVHLNGIAYARPEMNWGDDILGQFIKESIDVVRYLIKVYKATHIANPLHEIGGSKLLTFAWENMNSDYSIRSNESISAALQIAKKTEILVINGYSFPAFNRPIDQEIFNEMTGLSKIYIQSPQAKDIENIITSDLLEEESAVDLVDLGYWNQFYMPSEWSKEKQGIPYGIR